MKALKELGKWIQPQHLSRTAINTLKNTLTEEFNNGVFLDDFFQKEHINALQKVIDEEATYEECFMTWKNNEPVSKEFFMGTAEEDRFCFLQHINGVNPEFRKSNHWKMIQGVPVVLPVYISSLS